MRQIIFATLLMLVLVGTNVACNTVHGFGQDVERLGEDPGDVSSLENVDAINAIRDAS